MEYVVNVRKVMLKTLILTSWIKDVDDLTSLEIVDRIVLTVADYFRASADDLVGVHSSLAFARTPNFDIATSIDILSGKGYPRLPRCIGQVLMQESALSDSETARMIERLHQEIKSRLLLCYIPSLLVYIRLMGGCAVFKRQDEFEFAVTLQKYQISHSSPTWKMVYVRLFVQSSEDLYTEFEANMTGDPGIFGKRLAESMQQKIISSGLGIDPFTLLSVDLHNATLAYGLELLYQQSMILLKSRWSENISVEFVPRSFLKISYWSASPSLLATAAASSSNRPSMQVRLIQMPSADDLIASPIIDDSFRGEGQWEFEMEMGHSLQGVESLMRTSRKHGVKVDLTRLNLAGLLNETIIIHASFLLSEILCSLEPVIQKSGLFSIQLMSRDLGSIKAHENYIRIASIEEGYIEVRLFIDLKSGEPQFAVLGPIDKIFKDSLHKVQQKMEHRSMSVVDATRYLLLEILRVQFVKDPSLIDLDLTPIPPFQADDREKIPQCAFFAAFSDCGDWRWMIGLDEKGRIEFSLTRVSIISKCPLLFGWIESMPFLDFYRTHFSETGLVRRLQNGALSFEYLSWLLQDTHHFIRGLVLSSHLQQHVNIRWEIMHHPHAIEYSILPSRSPPSDLSSGNLDNLMGLCEEIRFTIFARRCDCHFYMPHSPDIDRLMESIRSSSISTPILSKALENIPTMLKRGT